jgi:AcrR family transcriptional regulator
MTVITCISGYTLVSIFFGLIGFMAISKMKKTGLSREIAEFKERRIVEEAVNLFYSKGYENATLDMLAAQLKVTKPFIYSYFKSKNELLFQVCHTGIKLSQEALDLCLQGDGTATEKLKRVTEQVGSIILHYRKYIVVYLREEKNLRRDDSRSIRKQRSLFDHRLAALLDEGNITGEFAVSNTLMTATTIGGTLTWMAFWFDPNGAITQSEILINTNRLIGKMWAP